MTAASSSNPVADLPERSAALARICAAARSHFADHGYDATSMSDIAQAIGIRKASLYSHIASKDQLFLQLLEEAASCETAFARLANQPPDASSCATAQPGWAYLQDIGERFESSAHLRFLLRAAYFPPQQHREAINVAFTAFITALRQYYLDALQSHLPDAFSAAQCESYAEAYIGIIDSLFVELFYVGQETMVRRRTAMWGLLYDSMILRQSQSAAPQPK